MVIGNITRRLGEWILKKNAGEEARRHSYIEGTCLSDGILNRKAKTYWVMCLCNVWTLIGVWRWNWKVLCRLSTSAGGCSTLRFSCALLWRFVRPPYSFPRKLDGRRTVVGVVVDRTTGNWESPTLSSVLYFVELSLPLWNIPILFVRCLHSIFV
jgi:hypothetical protein